MMALGIYLLIGLIWTFAIDRYSHLQLQLPPMRSGEILIQIFSWPVGLIIFSVNFFREVFSKKD
jgi:hypothetical protein